MEFDIQNSIKLLTPEYFEHSFLDNNCQTLVSVFRESVYNLVIPDRNFSADDLKQNQQKLSRYTKEGKEFSYYIPSEFNTTVGKLVEESGAKYDFCARYIFKNTQEKYQIPEHEIVRLNEQNFDEFLAAAAICFPDWNNLVFTRWSLECPAVETIGVVVDGKIVAFAGYFSKPSSDYVMLMNDGTLPGFRRQGLHDYLIKFRISEVLESKDSAIFYADVDEGSASHKGFTKLGFEDGPIFYGYN